MSIVENLQAQVDGLKQQVTDLQTSVDVEQQQIADLLSQNAAVVTSLNQQISDLQSQLANAVDPATLQPIVDGLTEVSNSIATTKTDIEGTV